MFSRTSTYALNILGFLVRSRGVRTRGEEIAKETGIPANYLSKILNQLRKQGIVDAEKGWGGGFEVRAEALERPIRDVLAIFEGVEPAGKKECLFGLQHCDSEQPCPLHGYWERIRDLRDDMLTRTTIADLGTGVGNVSSSVA